MNYEVIARSKSNIDKANLALVDKENWSGFRYRPRTTAKLEYIKDKGFQVKLECFESAPLARYKNFMDDVWTDSCMEFFINFAPHKSDLYLNFEMNSAGAWLVGIGPERDNRTVPEAVVKSGIAPKAKVESDRWSVKLFIPLEVVKEIYCSDIEITDGYKMKGNFYKCGEDTPLEHYLSWSPIESPHPEFHLPKYFSDMTVKF